MWAKEYLIRTAMSDFVIAAVCSSVAIAIRFGGRLGLEYAMLCVALPLLWVATLLLFGAYSVRSVGTGSDEFRKVLNAGFSLTAGMAILSYAVNMELSREYLLLDDADPHRSRSVRQARAAKAAAPAARQGAVHVHRAGGRTRAGGGRSGRSS